MKESALPIFLKELKLPVMLKNWKPLQEDAKRKGWSHTQYLSALCEHEVAERKSKRLQRRFYEARLPRGKSFETYDFKSISQLDKRQIDALIQEDSWINSGINVLIFGPSGVGKTHLGAAIGEKLVLDGKKVFFSRTTELVQKLQAAKRDLNLPQTLQKLDKFDCLILDDFGYVKKNELETSALFELICERYERRSLLLTCNQPFSEWDEIFVDKIMAVAAIDRLVHHSILIELEGESYRRLSALKKVSTRRRNTKK